MKNRIKLIFNLLLVFVINTTLLAQTNSFSPEALQEDFLQFRDILENEHCCLYEYTPKYIFDSLFDAHFMLLNHEMERDEFFNMLAPITAKIGCMHTATWMPGRFFVTKPDKIFPLKLKLINGKAIVTGSYLDSEEIPRGSILQEINGESFRSILAQLRKTTSGDALNPYFINAQLSQRFPLFYSSCYGLPDEYIINYLPPGSTVPEVRQLIPANYDTVNDQVLFHFHNPPLGFKILEGKDAALMTIPSFIYYDRVDYFRNFMDSCFTLIHTKGINNLILDVRGNTGGDPFCSSILLSYLQTEEVPYFSEPYGRYQPLSEPLPLPENHFNGNLYTLIDGSCGSTNGHFCALLKYHHFGKFIGTPSGATYKCNAGRNTELRLSNTQMIITFGRTTYAAAVKNMDTSAILPDIQVEETYEDFLTGKDVFVETALKEINSHTK
ncbi:MAG: hypothetical protein JW833_11120 [Prolixibacteraceae bacterium]|nr:hypothetical protein [Prolixibacteraceae bacterium]